MEGIALRNPEEPSASSASILLSKLVIDVSLLCDSSLSSASRDAKTIESRVRCEGLGFLTKVLPSLGKAIDRSFETGTLILPPGFRTWRKTKIPVFLRGIFQCAYSEDGCLKGIEASEAIRGLRQICYLYYKWQMGYSRATEAACFSSFVATDASLPLDIPTDGILEDAAQILEELLCDFNPLDIRPGHGPGAVATGERGCEKYTFKRVYSHTVSLFPLGHYFVAGGMGELNSRLEWWQSLDRQPVSVAKIVTVPKDSRGPRIISEEPLEIQWLQQGIKDELYPYVEKHPLTEGFVNFRNQAINGVHALQSSVSRKLATLDLKDASDRVSLALVRALFPEHVLSALEATRSSATRLPCGTLVPLRKFASMGSALCFPIEALTFWALSCAVISRESPGSDSLNVTSVYVYGDDLIVPSKYANLIISSLETYGLKFSLDKCFIQGFFRESCGVEAFRGVDVTPVRVKHWPDAYAPKPSLSSLIPSLDALSDSLWKRGYWRSAAFVAEQIERYIPLPYGVSTSSFACRRLSDYGKAVWLNIQSGFRCRWNHGLQKLEFFVHVVRTKNIDHPSFDGWARLLRSLLTDPGRRPTLFSTKETWLKRCWASV